MLRFLFRGRSHSQGHACDEVVREIAAGSVAAVLERLGADLSSMCAAELRGYVRARAARPVRTRVESLVAAGRSQSHADLLPPALERTVQLVVRELTSQPKALSPAYVASRRAG